MNVVESKRRVAELGLELGLVDIPEDWCGVDAVLPILERMKDEGAVVVIKLDGERTRDTYTAVVSGLPEGGVRVDASSLEAALYDVILAYAAAKWR